MEATNVIKPKRKRISVLSTEEKMMFRLREEYHCSAVEAWKKLKEFRFGKEMSRLYNEQIAVS